MQKGYIRVSICRTDGQSLQRIEADRIDQIVEIVRTKENEDQDFMLRHDVCREIQQTVDTIRQYKNENSLVFTLLTDSHMTVNGTWEDTVDTIRAVDDVIRPDGIIHLGDLEDGILSKSYCRYYKDIILNELLQH